MSKIKKNKVIAVVGTTASGKTALAVRIAREFSGEIVSADSRQVYRHMDIGSGKDLVEYGDTPYHLIDVAEPTEKYDLAKWLSGAKHAISDIIDRGHLPIIAGGTGLYAQALLDAYELSEACGDESLREELEALELNKIQEKLCLIDPVLFIKLNNSEKNNKRRLIRLIEILQKSMRPTVDTRNASPYDSLIIGLSWPRELLRQRIMDRIIDRLDNQGMMEEVISLHSVQRLSWERLESFGLEYKFIAQHLQGILSKEEMIIKLHEASCRFAKRQMTWLRRWEKQGAKIHWENDGKIISGLVRDFLAQT